MTPYSCSAHFVASTFLFFNLRFSPFCHFVLFFLSFNLDENENNTYDFARYTSYVFILKLLSFLLPEN